LIESKLLFLPCIFLVLLIVVVSQLLRIRQKYAFSGVRDLSVVVGGIGTFAFLSNQIAGIILSNTSLSCTQSSLQWPEVASLLIGWGVIGYNSFLGVWNLFPSFNVDGQSQSITEETDLMRQPPGTE
jgi:hypothetical protein